MHEVMVFQNGVYMGSHHKRGFCNALDLAELMCEGATGIHCDIYRNGKWVSDYNSVA